MIETITCFSHRYTLADANQIIVLLILVVIVLIVMGCYSIRYNRIISQRNEQLRRILTALDNYRAIVGDGVLSLDEQEAILKYKLKKTKEALPLKKDGEQNFFVMMDARINKERPYTDPTFDQDALIKFMGVSRETFCNLVPRYKDPDRTFDYINSLRAEYGARLIIEHPHEEIETIAKECGFIGVDVFNSAFKFALGVTPAEYRNSMIKLFKNDQSSTIHQQ